MHSIKLYCRYAALSIRSQMQYRVAFVTQTIAHFIMTGIEFLGLAALFGRFRQIDGWSLPEVGLFYGMIGVALAFASALPRGFDTFDRTIRSGDFDRILLRPLPAAYQIFCQELQLMRVGRVAQAMLVLVWSAYSLNIDWTMARLLLLTWAILGGTFLFTGLFILQATVCFWTVDSIEIMNCATYGGVEAGQFPLTIYRPWFRHIFTFVIPLATINYFPAHAILGRVDPLGSTLLMQWLSPLAGVIFLLVSLQIWRFGVRRYTSTGN